MEWDEQVAEKFDEMIKDVIPKFMQTKVQSKVKANAESLAEKRGSEIVEEEDLVEAFFITAPTFIHDRVKAALKKHELSFEE